MSTSKGRRIPASAIVKGQRVRVLVKGRWVAIDVVEVTPQNEDGILVLGERNVGRNRVTTIKNLDPDDLVTLVTR